MRGRYLLLVLCTAVGLLALIGCKEEVPQTELDRFVARIGALPGDVQEDSLQAMSEGGGQRAAFATYLLGNRRYAAGADSAMSSSWADPGVIKLLDEAEVYLSSAVAMDSSFVEALVNLGSLWDDRSEVAGPRKERDERVAEAKKFYQLALEVDPANEKARCNLGSLLLRGRKRMEAKEQFAKVLEYNPKSALGHYNMAIMFVDAKIYREALIEWEEAVKCDPEGDIGQRSRDNIKIVKDLMKNPLPDSHSPKVPEKKH